MKRVERKGFNSKREMDIMDALNEVKLMNKRKQKVNYDELLLQTLMRHDQLQKSFEDSVIAGLNGGKTDDELRKEFAEKKKYRRLEEENLADFETVEEIDDPYAFLGQKEDSSSDEEFKAPEVKTCF